MIVNRMYCVTCALCCALLTLTAIPVMGQDASPAQRASTEKTRDSVADFDTELYLLRASSDPREGDGDIPASLGAVVKQLRATLAFKHYRLASTLLNRVGNHGNLNLLWIGGPVTIPTTTLAGLPIFSDFSIGRLTLVDIGQEQLVQLQRVRFGARVPVQTGTNIAASGTNSAPVWVYENTGITTDVAVRADQPVVLGTLNVGASGEALIVIINAKRVQK